MSEHWTLNHKNWLISQEALEEWLDSLMQQRTVIAPREVDGILLYRPVQDSGEIAWGFTKTRMSVKEVFFPPTERLLSIKKIGREINLHETLPEGQSIVFGVRPCDARGMKILDAMFIDTNPVDPYYQARRDNTAIIGLACKQIGDTCFCTSLGGAPDDARDVDVMLYETGEGYMVEAATDKGRFLIPGGEWPQIDGKYEPRPAPVNPQSTTCGELTRTIHNLQSINWHARFNDEYWQKMSERCLSCRACAYICPTCRCFAVRDEAIYGVNGQFERIRSWDSCTGENYRRIAGGHKPRAEKGERLRNRIYCKFHFYPQQYGLGEASACTGCGRCVDVCPVNVDITEVLTDLAK